MSLTRNRLVNARHITLVAVLLLPLIAPAAGMYKWVDKDGNVHFSDRPPEEEQVSVEELELDLDLDPEREAEGVTRLEDSQNSLDERRQTRTAAEERRARQRAEVEKKAAQRQAQCHLARSNLAVLREQRPVYTFNDKGERVYIEDQHRQARIDESQRAVTQYCN